MGWTRKIFLGLKIDWNYRYRHFTVSMPNCINQALQKFQHHLNPKPTNSPSNYNTPNYGAKIQYAKPEDTRKLPPLSDIPHVQQVIRTLLYYTISVDTTILSTLEYLASAQSKSMVNTMETITHLLNYTEIQPNVKIQYHKSGTMACIYLPLRHAAVSEDTSSSLTRHLTLKNANATEPFT